MQNQQPRINLQCQHNYCYECLEQHLQKDFKSFVCPVDYDNFNDNNNKNNYSENKLNNEDFDLEFLKQESDLLNGTQQSINISSFIQNQTGRNSLNSNFQQILLCQKHNKPYEICCIKCQEVICTMCAIFDQKKSSQCKFAQLEQVQKEMEQIELEFERKKQKVQNEMEMIFSEIEQATQKNINAQLDTLIYRFQSYMEACDNILKQDELIGEKNEILSKFGLNFKIYNNYKYSMEESKELQQQMFEFQSENEQKLKQNKIYINLLQKLDELNFQPDQGVINSIKNLKGILTQKQNDNQQQIQQNDQQEIQNLQRSTFTFQGKQSQNQIQLGQNYNKFQQQEMGEKIILKNNQMNFSQQSDFSHPEQINSSQNQNNNSYNNISGINMQEQFGESLIEEDQYQNLNQGQNQFYDQDQIRGKMVQKNQLKNDKNKNNDTNQQQHIQNSLQQKQFQQQQQINSKNYNQALLDSTCSTFYNGQNGNQNQNQKKDSGKSQKSLLSGKNQPKQIQKSTSAFNILVGQKQKKNIISSGQNNKKSQQQQYQGNTNPTQKCKKFELENNQNQNQTLNQKFSNQQQQLQQLKQLSGSLTARNLPGKNFQKLGNCNTSRDNSQKSSQTLNQIQSARIPSRKLNKSSLSDRDIDYLVGYLEQYPQQINSIKLLKNKITDVGFQKILGFLSKNTTVTQLNLLQNNISVRALDLIGQYLQQNSTLKEIILIKNDPGLIKERQKIMILQEQLGIYVQVKQ
ncbi:hypothetical protein PPERSA_00009 [Pseudocohnilembus persalinus]|uniref:B box-type domain-containing protein n=1 Tax=Pseudocohnilembus persalinus TaxID=266149 RepID=A0A0V0QVC3_PSEPJ|nr:hypothetical protein PPERSA_00009 [Pseudocohnilembus persalinus]|eukprot:KRX06129.1 hypothetical protein PPERSA_00009 [Pseudocohnilembus persalinus]